MQVNYRSRYLATVDNEQSMVNICRYDKFKFDEAFLVLQPSKILFGKSRMCRMTEMSGARNISEFKLITI